MKKSELAPIVIFAFKRPEKLKKLLLSLEENAEFKESKILFYVDKYLDKSDKKRNEEVLEIVNEHSNNSNFEIHYNKKNLGLKKNILQGINNSLDKYENAIFIEDDLIVGKYFLNYMNASLNFYENKKEIKHISGYNYPTFLGSNKSNYFTSYMNCWGWATWSDRWFENTNFTNNLISELPKKKRLDFTVYGLEKDFESQLLRNENNEIETWAIFWYQHIFLSGGLCVNPKKTLVQNTGNDNEATHKINSKIYNSKINNHVISTFSNKSKFDYINKLQTVWFYIIKKIKKKINS